MIDDRDLTPVFAMLGFGIAIAFGIFCHALFALVDARRLRRRRELEEEMHANIIAALRRLRGEDLDDERLN